MKKINGGVAVIEKDGKHFLICQSKNKPLGGYWRHPGGSFKLNESFKEGIKREIKEETGLEIEVIDDNPIHVEKIDYKPGFFGFFRAKLIGGEIKIDENEIEKWGWFNRSEIKKLKLMKATKAFYKKIY